MFDTIIIPKNLLIIDDNPDVRKIFADFFGSRYNCCEAESVEAALGALCEKEFSVVLSNYNLPKLSGMETIKCIQSQSPNSVIVLIGEQTSSDEVIKVFRSGVFDYIQQPFKLSEINQAVKKAFEQYELKSLKNNYQIHLEELSSHRATELDKALEEIENSYRITLKALVQALETRDFETHGHSERVVTYSLRLGHEVGMEKEALKNLELGALLHDIGKIGVPDAILRKPAKLTEEEWEKMKLHPQHGQKILRNIEFLEGAARVVAQHHEQWDGTGYPFKLRGEEIDLGARIFAVVDAFDAMTSDRVYRRGCGYEAALEELQRCAGTQFDPAIVEAFQRVPREDWEVLRRRSLAEKQEIFSFQNVVAELVYSKQQFELVH
jgi:response regulator RpfG family c-di-GMP phosphodiesterase